MASTCSDANWREAVLNASLGTIDAVDLVCAHISTPDAYGTLAEIVYAATTGIKVSLTIFTGLKDQLRNDRDVHDLWFIEQMARRYDGATNHVDSATDARRAHAGVIRAMNRVVM
jgi:nucleoside 2-deoxyribosyltransferase